MTSPWASALCRNCIGGAFVAALDGETLVNTAPSTGAALGTTPRSRVADVDAAVEAAVAAGPAWAATPVAARAALLDRVAALIEAHARELAELEAEDSGKTLSMASTVDIPRAVANLRFFAAAIRTDCSTPALAMHDAINYTTREPVGVCGLITPWNLPLYLLTWKLAPALACGNTVVAKPSEVTPRSASALAALFVAAGAPPGVFNVVHGLGSEAGAALVAHPRVRLVSFTGGTATGAAVAAVAAPLFKKLSLELGGKNATVIFADTPLATAVAAAVRAGYTNNGQVCLCGSRVFVQRPLYAAFCDAFGAAVAALRVGDCLGAGVDVGPLSSAAHRDKVAGFIALGVAEGAQVLAGGPGVPEGLPAHAASGYYVRPTAFAGLDAATSRCSRDEVFGPVVTVHPFEDENDAVRLVNDSKYGLCANVWTTDVRTAHSVARRLAVGMVWINCWLHRDLRTAFGGIKDSGLGREGGTHSLDVFSEMKVTTVMIGAPAVE